MRREPGRITFPIEPLVVLGDGPGPRTEPLEQRTGDPSALRGMAPDHLPFVLVELPGLVQDPRGHRQLADVVEQRGPSEPVALLRRELHLLGQEVGEDANAFGVAAGAAVVGLERHGQCQDPFSRQGLLFSVWIRVERCKPTPESPDAAGLSGHHEA